MNKIITFFTILWFSHSLMDAANYKSIIISKNDDSIVCINIKDELKITCHDDSMFVSGATYEFAFALPEIKGWIHDTDLQEETDPSTTSIWSHHADQTNMSYTSDHISLTNLPYGSDISIYSIDGTLKRSKKSVSGNEIISLKDFTPGVYVLKVNGQSTKILIR